MRVDLATVFIFLDSSSRIYIIYYDYVLNIIII